jgi:hypothetical protein
VIRRALCAVAMIASERGRRSADSRAPRVSAITAGSVRFVGVDGSRNRDIQRGGRVEGGLRFEGECGAIELVVAGERRIDAAPFDFSALGWVSAGFRFVRR